ncbi:hypothetical protein B0H14DRAFT_3142429 [Mycena olivaceomarginata]|nr:hypothetical protein B0H14DRAFT_3142429 [Mycena olivaceomarginata]
MAFSLNGTHIKGGTFNSVAGNMSQVFNSHTIPAGLLPGNEVSRDHPQLEGGHRFTAITTGSSGSIGPIRSQRALRNEDRRPYGHLRPQIQHVDDQPEPSDSLQSPTPETVAITYSLPVYPSQFQQPLQNHDAPAQGQNNSNTFNSIAGDMTQLSVTSTSYGESAMEALHDSGERFPEPACHPGTRIDIMEKLHSWSTDTSTESTILWLHGCAGAGKSAIAQMFAKSLQTEGRLGASFFFQRGHLKQGTWHSLIPTIAYQLATSVTELLLPIQRAVEGDKLIVGRALAISFQVLLVEPLKKLSDLQRTPVIVLDGLDECADHKIQQQILNLFIDAIWHHNLHLRLLIASRPEPHLHESAYHDIWRYFHTEFSRIRCAFIARGISLEPEWPSPDAVDRLVSMSSATFIYATTVIHFIDDEYHHPADRLNSVLELDPRSTAPLDDLYTQILSVVPQEQEGQQLRILHTICIGKGEHRGRIYVDPEEIDILLNLRTGTCRLILRRLHSLFKVPPIRTRFGTQESIGFLHASFGDYLSDTRRSGRREVSHHLSNLLKNATPSEALVDLLRNHSEMHGLRYTFSPTFVPKAKEKPPIPPDLVQLWDDLRAAAGLREHLHVSSRPGAATFNSLSFFHYPSPTEIHHLTFWPILREPGGSTQNPLILQKNWCFVGLAVLEGHSQEVLVNYIRRHHLQTIEKCGTSQKLLREFATFNLSDLCRQMAIDVRAHEDYHKCILWDRTLCAVLDWLRSFPDNPLPRQVLAFWERQVNAMRLCPKHIQL